MDIYLPSSYFLWFPQMGKGSDQDVVSWLLTQKAAAAHMYTHTEYHYKHLYVIGTIIVIVTGDSL